MISEQQKYLSGTFKTFGFTFFAPIGSVLFQLLLFKKSVFEGYFLLSLLLIISFLALAIPPFVLYGIYLNDQKNKKSLTNTTHKS